MAPLQRQSDFLSDSEHSFIDVDASLEPQHLKANDNSSNNNSNNDSSAPRRSVRFGSVQVREYDRIVGDHPEVKVGPPIGIGWEYMELEPLNMEEYEAQHQRRFVRRLSSITRKNMLLNGFGIPEEEIRQAELENQRIMAQAAKKKTALAPVRVVKSARRKLKGMLLGDAMMKGLAAAAGSMIPGGSSGIMGSNAMGVY